jgi:hypothetical protein
MLRPRLWLSSELKSRLKLRLRLSKTKDKDKAAIEQL